MLNKSNFLLYLMMLPVLGFMSAGCANLEEAPLQMFRHDPRHTGIYESPAIREKPVMDWYLSLEGRIYGSPVISGNRVYIGDDTGTLYAIDKFSGELIWKFKAGGPIRSTPAVYRENLFFMCSDGLFYSVNAIDGNISWTFRTAGEKKFSAPGIHGLQPRDSILTDDWDFYNSSAAVEDERVYFGVGAGYVYSLNAGTGEKVWEYQTGAVVHSSHAIAFEKVYVGSWDGYFYALDKITGELVWKFQTGIDTVNYNQVGIQSSPVIGDSTVYFGSRDAHVYSLDALTGNLRWKFFNDYSWVIVTPIIYNDQLIFATSDSRKFRVLNRENGQLIYDLELASFTFSSPIIAGDYCYFGSYNGTFYGIDLIGQRIGWNYQTRESAEDQHDILNEDLSVNLQKIFTGPTPADMKRGIDYLESVGAIISTPVIESGTLYFGTQNGTLYAVIQEER